MPGRRESTSAEDPETFDDIVSWQESRSLFVEYCRRTGAEEGLQVGGQRPRYCVGAVVPSGTYEAPCLQSHKDIPQLPYNHGLRP
jgi:hypothetical protein